MRLRTKMGNRITVVLGVIALFLVVAWMLSIVLY